MSEFKRLTKIEYGYLLALAAKARSEDPRTNVGGIAFDENWKTLGSSTNGWKSGYVPPDELNLEENREKKNDLILHAEQNLLNFISVPIHRIFLTISCCQPCAKNIAARGVKEVYFIEEYWRKCEKYKEIFDFYGVKYFQATREEKLNIKEYLLREGLKL